MSPFLNVLDSFPPNKCGFWQTNERHVSSGAACLERHEVRDELLLQLPGAASIHLCRCGSLKLGDVPSVLLETIPQKGSLKNSTPV